MPGPLVGIAGHDVECVGTGPENPDPAGGRANVPGLWGAALFLVLLLTMLNTFGVSAGVRLVLTGLVIVAVITAAGVQKAPR